MSDDEAFVSAPVPSTTIPTPATSLSPLTTVNISVVTVITNIYHLFPFIFAQHCLSTPSQYPPHGYVTWVQSFLTNLHKFNGEGASINAWISRVKWEGINHLTGIMEDKRAIDVVIRSRDCEFRGSLASFIGIDISITHFTSWSESWSDNSNSLFSRNVVADHTTRAFGLRELSRSVSQCVWGHKFDSSTSTVDSAVMIVEGGGWGLRGAVGKVSTSLKSGVTVAQSNPILSSASSRSNTTLHGAVTGDATINPVFISDMLVSQAAEHKSKTGGVESLGAVSKSNSNVLCGACGEAGHRKREGPVANFLSRVQVARTGQSDIHGRSSSSGCSADVQQMQPSMRWFCVYHPVKLHGLAVCTWFQKIGSSVQLARSYFPDSREGNA